MFSLQPDLLHGALAEGFVQAGEQLGFKELQFSAPDIMLAGNIQAAAGKVGGCGMSRDLRANDLAPLAPDDGEGQTRAPLSLFQE